MEQLFRKQHYCARNMALKENEIISMFDFKFAGPPQGWFYSRGITKISPCTGLMAYMYCHTIISWDRKMLKHLNFKQFQMKLQVSHFLARLFFKTEEVLSPPARRRRRRRRRLRRLRRLRLRPVKF